MKYLMAALGGFALTLGAFVCGVGFAIAYLTAEPVRVQNPAVDVAMLWPSSAVKVDTMTQAFERIERRPVVEPPTQEEPAEPQVDIDDTTTASVDDLQTSDPVTQGYDHIRWCANRYRSYRPSDNS